MLVGMRNTRRRCTRQRRRRNCGERGASSWDAPSGLSDGRGARLRRRAVSVRRASVGRYGARQCAFRDRYPWKCRTGGMGRDCSRCFEAHRYRDHVQLDVICKAVAGLYRNARGLAYGRGTRSLHGARAEAVALFPKMHDTMHHLRCRVARKAGEGKHGQQKTHDKRTAHGGKIREQP